METTYFLCVRKGPPFLGGNEIQNISDVTYTVSQGPVNGRKLSDQRIRTCER